MFFFFQKFKKSNVEKYGVKLYGSWSKIIVGKLRFQFLTRMSNNPNVEEKLLKSLPNIAYTSYLREQKGDESKLKESWSLNKLELNYAY